MKLAARIPVLAILALVSLSLGCDDESPDRDAADAAVDSGVNPVPDAGLDAGPDDPVLMDGSAPGDAGDDASPGDDAGDASEPDAGDDAGQDAGDDASPGDDSGVDAGIDAGIDAGCPACSPLLLGLAVDRGTLTPAFDPAVTEYQLRLKLWEDSVGITATADDIFAVTLAGEPSGAAEVALTPGTNVVTISVSSAQAELTYTVTIERGVGLEHYIKASNAQAGDGFAYGGLAISADGNTMVVGAPLEDSSTSGVNPLPDELLDKAGAVYVLSRNPDGSWTEADFIKAFNPGASDRFGGWGVALSGDGNTLAVGAPGESSSTPGVDSTPDELVTDELADESGAVYVYTRSDGSWQPQAYIKAHNLGRSDAFGYSVAMSHDGSTLAVGAFKENSSSTGVDSMSNDSASNAGAAYVFARSDGIWAQQAYVKPHNTGTRDSFGIVVALDGSGDVLAVGARSEDSSSTGINSVFNDSASDTGAAYVFRRAGGAWSQDAYIKPDLSSAGDSFGEHLALSTDGRTLAVTSLDEDSATSGVNTRPDERARAAGAAYVFTHGGDGWEQQAYIKASNSGRSDRFGSAVKLNADGSVLAVSAIEEASVSGDPTDNSGYRAGALYVFTRKAEGWAEQAYLKAPQMSDEDEFGTALAISEDGRTLVCGTPFEDSSSLSDQAPNEDAIDSGAVWVF